MNAAREIGEHSAALRQSDPSERIDDLVGTDDGVVMDPVEIGEDELNEFVAFVRHHCANGPRLKDGAVIVSFSATWDPFFPESTSRNRTKRPGETFRSPRLLRRIRDSWRTHSISTREIFRGGRCFLDAHGVWRKDAGGERYRLLRWKIAGKWPFRDPHRVVV